VAIYESVNYWISEDEVRYMNCEYVKRVLWLFSYVESASRDGAIHKSIIRTSRRDPHCCTSPTGPRHRQETTTDSSVL